MRFATKKGQEVLLGLEQIQDSKDKEIGITTEYKYKKIKIDKKYLPFVEEWLLP